MGSRIANVHEQEYKGTHYRSTLEAKTAETLDGLGIPFAYEERKIELLEGFRSPFQKDKVRSVTYCPDFIIGPILLECKGFETPEWKLKKKLLFKWLQENEPDTLFYQIRDAKKSLLQVLDQHLVYLGYCVEVMSKPTRKSPSVISRFDSVSEAMQELGLEGRNLGPILNSLVGRKQWVYNYNWKLKKIII